MLQRVVRRSTPANQQAEDLAYWLSQPVQARIDAVEQLRLEYARAQGLADIRLQRVCRVTQLRSR